MPLQVMFTLSLVVSPVQTRPTSFRHCPLWTDISICV